MMKYKSLYINLFPLFIRKYMNEQFGKDVTSKSLKGAKKIYRQMLNEVDDIGSENPMAGNIYMAFVFMAIWKASEGAIDSNGFRIVTRRLLTESPLRKFIGKNDLNSPDGVKTGYEKMKSMQAWIDEHPQYRDTSWDFNFDESLHKDGFYYHFTRCPLNDYARKFGYLEILPVCCDLDHILTEASHGKLIRKNTLAEGGPVCDYWIVPDKIKNPE